MRSLSIAILMMCIAVTTDYLLVNAEVHVLDNANVLTGTERITSCVTGKSLPGTCVRRERCDYGSGNIDFTLYKPNGFKKICSSEEVCCPPEYLVQSDSKTLAPEEDLTFDEDD